ncbi:4-hydroxy-tetrahydrodipicolinate synthase [Stackebrandtia nassauensis]|uniref:4-hydroxy-tetrahydrodipicolinate synthase n=1 Tax=Stackebrandtia nassauensis (strain DSM 44728 / CIP 108903 / NRRL B-16338 / NBRC 102104 / LLR-40K-21) TaxID=446470 RepID=D3Q2I9_STANL|nr:4-hydroxy-tetrahydrodipicolinate synthase [Stackebrandtia nassauensis]ADD43922.1 dihydrodipicolinate synthase [Stackebrandtia nassauensis DSM 44728]
MTRQDANRPFGRLLTAMITPFHADGSLDVDGAKRLATYLVDEQRCDGLVVNGTTGESPTTTDEEKAAVVKAVVEAVGDRASVVAGAGTYDTAHSVKLIKRMEDAGAHGLLLVTPYYSRPLQDMLYRHFTTLADAASTPIMLYDIPPRSARELERDTIVKLAAHPRVVAVKDATQRLYDAQRKRVESGLPYYNGVDDINLAAYASGQVGAVSVIAHLVGKQLTEMFDAHDSGDVARARQISDDLLPAVWALQDSTQGLCAVKSALAARGLPAGPPRAPLYAAEPETSALIESLLKEAKIS